MKKMPISLCFLFLLISSVSAVCHCPRCILYGKAAYTTNPAALSPGACGYGSLALPFNDGYIAAGVPSLFRDGVGCGACFQVKCLNETLCSSDGTKVVLTDINKSSETDLVLSDKAFMAMAHEGKGQELLQQEVVGIKYERVPCVYNKSLEVRVEESSQNPHNLSVRFLYQGGLTDISMVAVSQGRGHDWNYFEKSYGGVWNNSQVPTGPLDFQLVMQGGYDGMPMWGYNVLPADWKIGTLYDTGINITAIACLSCEP